MTEQEYIHIETLAQLRVAKDVLASVLFVEDGFNQRVKDVQSEVYKLIRHLEKNMPDITYEDSE